MAAAGPAWWLRHTTPRPAPRSSFPFLAVPFRSLAPLAPGSVLGTAAGCLRFAVRSARYRFMPCGRWVFASAPLRPHRAQRNAPSAGAPALAPIPVAPADLPHPLARFPSQSPNTNIHLTFRYPWPTIELMFWLYQICEE